MIAKVGTEGEKRDFQPKGEGNSFGTPQIHPQEFAVKRNESRNIPAAATCADAEHGYGNAQLDLFAEELSLAGQRLGEITGEVTADDLLGRIFSRFCIGK